MRIFRSILLCFFVSLAGCATELTPEGRMVRRIQADWATKCEFLGAIDASESFGWDIADDRKGALNKIRNKVAEMGGNAFVLNEGSSSAMRTSIQADAYKCP